MTKFLDIFAIAIVGALLVVIAGFVFTKLTAGRSLPEGRLAQIGLGNKPNIFDSFSVALLGACAAVYFATFLRFETVQSTLSVRESSSLTNTAESLATAADLAGRLNDALLRIEQRKHLDTEDAALREKLVEELRVKAEEAKARAMRAEFSTSLMSNRPSDDATGNR